MKQNNRWKYLITGGLAGLANGLFGAGGGLFLVPLLSSWAKMPRRNAFAVSVGVILPLSIVSAVVYSLKGGLDLTGAWPYLIGGFLGGIVSGRVFQKVPVVWLRRGFGLLIIYGGLRALWLG